MHIIVAALALGAAAIHVAAGPAHVEALGDLGLGFYWVAIFQAAIGIGFLAAGASTTFTVSPNSTSEGWYMV